MVGALPKDLVAMGHDVRVVCPAYSSIKISDDWSARAEPLGVEVGAATHWGRTWQSHLPNSEVPVYLLEHSEFFDRPEVYAGPWGDHPDNDLRFIFLCRGALTLCLQLDWIPDVIHCHDWTTGFIPLMLNTTMRNSPLGNTATVFTIHNLEHQGYCDRRALDFARVPAAEFRADSTESHGKVNMMKAGLYHSTKITTVSPTYAEEIKTTAGGFGLDNVLRFRAADLLGIVNGIDGSIWNPATDPKISHHYSAKNFGGKSACKAELQKQLGLDIDPHIALFGVVSRFATQKGLDLLAEALPFILERMHVQFVVLGSGDPGLEQVFREAAHRFPKQLGLHVGFNGKLASQIQAASDFFVMPSRAEPCGLTQLYAMAYGTRRPGNRRPGRHRRTIRRKNRQGHRLQIQRRHRPRALQHSGLGLCDLLRSPRSIPPTPPQRHGSRFQLGRIRCPLRPDLRVGHCRPSRETRSTEGLSQFGVCPPGSAI